MKVCPILERQLYTQGEYVQSKPGLLFFPSHKKKNEGFHVVQKKTWFIPQQIKKGNHYFKSLNSCSFTQRYIYAVTAVTEFIYSKELCLFSHICSFIFHSIKFFMC